MNEFEKIKLICEECMALRELLSEKIPGECYLGETEEGDLILKKPNLFGVCYVINLHNEKIKELEKLISELPDSLRRKMPTIRKIILKAN